MQVKDFTYELPQELIAQYPLEPRDHSRLLVVDKNTGTIEHRHFYDLCEYLRHDDLLVFNDTRVIPARLHGVKDTGARVEVFLLTRLNSTDWEVLFADTDFGGRIARFYYNGVFEEILDRLGETPLPPYITAPLEDKERYQTVYSRENGSAAAPTAGLHFTKELLQKIRDIGCEEVFVTLHVGLGTFRPVSVDDIKDHVMHREFYSVSPEAAEAINKAKAEGRRIVAVGTTAVRTLEAAGESGVIKAGGNWTNIFIYPGYRFRLVNSLITNFHLPQSTLLMLVSALSTREIMLSTYAEAVREHYRFFSFGDAMFITDLNK